MKINKHLLLILCPIFILFLWASYHEINSNIGTERTFEIRGYDPRDLLSGHYLTYDVIYDNFDGETCLYKYNDREKLCLDTGKLVEKGVPCKLELAGTCRYNRFDANINRFYIPQEHAEQLDKLLRNNIVPASIKVLITNSGTAYVKELYFDGMPWQEYIKNADTIQQSSSSIDAEVAAQE